MREKMPRCFIKFSQLILKGNVWTSVLRICMWILGLKGLIMFLLGSLGNNDGDGYKNVT